MLKQSIRFPVLYFVILTAIQFVKGKEISWVDNFMICFIIFLFFLLFIWADIPYKWKKDQ